MILANLLYEESAGRILLRAMPVLLFVLAILALAYRYYSAFLAAKVLALDDANATPAHRFNDGQNYHPTNKWVLFGHHFAAISGAGPLIGPILALQYGYAPGLFWLVAGVCLAGAVQDMMVLAASMRRDGKSLAEIARTELGPWASLITSMAIIFIVIIALAGLGFVVVKALGGEEVKLPGRMEIKLPPGEILGHEPFRGKVLHEPTLFNRFLAWLFPQRYLIAEFGLDEQTDAVWKFPPGCQVRYQPFGPWSLRSEAFQVRCGAFSGQANRDAGPDVYILPTGAVQVIPGSSWGMFTIACTIPIALLVSLYMYKFRKGRVVEASFLGALGVLAATVAGAWIPGSALEPYFSLTQGQTILALGAYGFIASVLPVWLLLCPRDYLSSFLKIGTIALLIVGVVCANPVLRCPPLNDAFVSGGPTFEGGVFPFVFICIMCGAVSGFHALVSSGTTPKMIDKETHVRPIGYGAMLMEGLVGIVALIAGASMDLELYYDINVGIGDVAKFQPQLQELYRQEGLLARQNDPLHQVGVDSVQHLNLAQVEEMVGGESLRGRTGGAVTLAVGMALILTEALRWTALPIASAMKYWYHFAIMFEALFILTTIDTGTRIARFILQETLGRIHSKMGQADWLPGSLLATALVTVGWCSLVATGSIQTIWPMFGIANQLLAVLALCLLTTWLINTGRTRSIWVTLLPMLFVTATTLAAGVQLIGVQLPRKIELGRQSGNAVLQWTGGLSITLALFIMIMVSLLLLGAASRWGSVWLGRGRLLAAPPGSASGVPPPSGPPHAPPGGASGDPPSSQPPGSAQGANDS